MEKTINLPKIEPSNGLLYLPRLEPSDGLSLNEILKITERVPVESWKELCQYNAPQEEWVFAYEPSWWSDESEHFRYEYLARQNNLDFYLATDIEIFSRRVAIKIVKGNMPIGYTGKIKKREYPQLSNLIDMINSYTSRLDDEQGESIMGEKQVERERIIQMRNTIIGEIRETFDKD